MPPSGATGTTSTPSLVRRERSPNPGAEVPMLTPLKCPRGHHWDFGNENATVTPQVPVACPTGTVVGTPSYVAPEQARTDSRRIGPGTDVYPSRVRRPQS